MMDRITACPICQGTSFATHLSCKDYTVSGETFQLIKCASCGFVLTNPRPTETELPGYYQSQAYISHSDKPSNLIDRVYKISRKFTLKWKYDLIRHHSTHLPQSILDYGCGTGAFLKQCQEEGMQVAGVEPSDLARKQAADQLQLTIVPTLRQAAGTYDVITLWHVLEHVSQLDQTLDQLKSHLAESGTMFIAVPNLHSADAAFYREHWAAYDVPRHLWHFSKATMGRLLKNHQLKLAGVLPMKLDAYYVSLLSEKYKRDGKLGIATAVHAALRGMRSNILARKTTEYSSLIYIVRQ